MFPATWRDAWNWARMRRHLDDIESREELITLAERRREIESGLARRYSQRRRQGRVALDEAQRDPKAAAGARRLCDGHPQDRSGHGPQRHPLSA